MKKILLSYLWLLGCCLLILTSIGFYRFSYMPQYQPEMLITQPKAEIKLALKKEKTIVLDGLESTLDTADARSAIVAEFLQEYNSPLEPHDYYGQKLVEIADKYKLDFRLLPAIMMEESNLCKNIPEGTYNCLGFGIHSRGTLGFENYEAGWERAAKELRANYVEQGRLTVSMIAKKYCASVDKWTNSVNQWMAEMKYNDRKKGIEKKTDSNVLEYVSED
ncbi:MAG: hypothetical protein U9O78_03810 [Patescibacteria group bacterium]|nr:hypothetical protein [Patescibacteria group bacterium]